MYTTDYFIDKFEKIPEGKWYTGALFNSRNPEQCCAMGHCGVTADDLRKPKESQNKEVLALMTLFNRNNLSVPCINDAKDDRFPQQTPKQRVLAALYQIKAKEKVEPIVIFQVVEVDSKVKDLVKENLILS